AQGEHIWLGFTQTRQGYNWYNHQELERASAVAAQARELLERCEAQHYVAIVVELQGKIATDNNEWDQAYTLLDTARATYEAQGMVVLAAQAGLHRANVDYWLDAWNDAEQGYRAMAEVARRFGSYHHIILAESNLALLASNQGRHDEALRHTRATLDQAVALQ
ncbi:hypothetical protein, partial [Streptomyces rochei]|uniref:hypothetical protein n=1 Tax=Streptomyces rochei TaxID=1928 RepID=UPI0022E9AFBD